MIPTTLSLTSQYVNLVQKVLATTNKVPGRNGLMRRVWSPEPLVVENCDVNFPFLLDRAPAVYLSVLETCFFLNGDSSFDAMPVKLQETFWQPWSEHAKRVGSYGRFYATQWRAQQTESGVPFDALSHLIGQLAEVKKTRIENRKMVVSLWRTADALARYTQVPAALESCHSTSLIFNLEERDGEWRLDMHHTQRSLDLLCGTGPDLIYSGLLMHLLAQHIGVKAGKLVFAPVNVHIYESHYEQALAHYEAFDIFDFDFEEIATNLRPNALQYILDGKAPKTLEEARAFVTFSGCWPVTDLKRVKFEVQA